MLTGANQNMQRDVTKPRDMLGENITFLAKLHFTGTERNHFGREHTFLTNRNSKLSAYNTFYAGGEHGKGNLNVLRYKTPRL